MTDDLRGLLARAALAGDDIPLSVDAMIRDGRRRRRRVAGSLTAVAALAVAGIVVASGTLVQRGDGNSSTGGTAGVAGATPGAAGVTFQRVTGGVTAIFHNPHATAAELHEAFLQQGIDVAVELAPVSPSLVGQVVSPGLTVISGQQITGVNGSQWCEGPGQADPCSVGVMIPSRYNGSGRITIGRAARPGELYVTANDATATGEPLACTAMLGATIAEAQVILHQRGLTASWTATGSSKRVDPSTLGDRVVVNAVATSPGQVLLEAEPRAEFLAYPARAWPCGAGAPAPHATEPVVLLSASAPGSGVGSTPPPGAAAATPSAVEDVPGASTTTGNPTPHSG